MRNSTSSGSNLPIATGPSPTASWGATAGPSTQPSASYQSPPRRATDSYYQVGHQASAPRQGYAELPTERRVGELGYGQAPPAELYGTQTHEMPGSTAYQYPSPRPMQGDSSQSSQPQSHGALAQLRKQVSKDGKLRSMFHRKPPGT
jgi:hypothetical protein